MKSVGFNVSYTCWANKRILGTAALYLCCLLLMSCNSSRTTNEIPTATPTPGLQAGDTILAEKDGVTLIYIPAGEFIMGSDTSDSAAQDDEFPQHTIYLDAFWIDQTEVTNRLYLACAEANRCAPVVSPRPEMTTAPDQPIIGVAWPEAVNYCRWVGRRLPTEAEWEKAARGVDARLYPWGNNFEAAQQVNIDFRVGDFNDAGSNVDDRSLYGVLDMAGNAPEWTVDWYQKNYYAQSPARNPTGPESGQLKVTRGGAWNVAPRAARSANRFWSFPDRDDFTGFRCAMDAVR